MKQGTIYSAVVNFINSYKLGETYTSEDFKAALEDITRRHRQHLKHNGQWYRCRTYQTYLRGLGFITNVRRGVWRINYHVPDWMSLYALETLRGYKDGYWNGREYVKRPDTFRNELSARLKAYKQRIDKDGVEESSPVKPIGWKIGDRIKITEDQPIYTIESFTDSSQERINLTWVDSRDRKQSLKYEYAVEQVNKCVARDRDYKWKVQQDTNKRIMKCIDAGGYMELTVGKDYEILEDDGKYYELLDNNNTPVHMFKTRFTEIKTPQQDTIKDIPKDRLPQFLKELETLIAKYK